ncbi:MULTISPECIES: class I SAM-dependent methyltransferase [unclassified Arsukibacterium]|uniref:class I SAM-dependent methyltransferase n=1 Tax=unclassified Arsukibacterium TaxID=2635278 RepID=UPI000C6772F3|nr:MULTISPECIES: class I SAM-dependent methyltransferase [unclassified Arsukibacterium]MAA94274.1 hypothetical protein [Rheinheimera sp.]MBM34654.1 hypothetical protein [Rheinheimera sp.]|tara:strand:+ start:8650 stop:9516 length:867 start_codon:yes stop_codon:yes gene_type:complete
MSNTGLLICASQCWPDETNTAAASFDQLLANQILQRNGWRGRLLLALVYWRWGRALLRGVLQCSLPGILSHYQWRKQHIAARLRRQIAQHGVRQLLIIGAGFDALGAKFSSEFSHLQVIEIDRPATMDIKQQVLQQLNALQPNLCLKAADLACCSVAELLAEEPAFSTSRSTLVLAEGVLMYLTQPAINTLLLQLRQIMDAPLQLVATQMQLNLQGKPRFIQQSWLTDLALAISSEPFVSGVSPQGLASWLASVGFTLQQLVAAAQPGNTDPCPGELLFYANVEPTDN